MYLGRSACTPPMARRSTKLGCASVGSQLAKNSCVGQRKSFLASWTLPEESSRLSILLGTEAGTTGSLRTGVASGTAANLAGYAKKRRPSGCTHHGLHQHRSFISWL